ncbi:probable E3 ubiquitin-protein ligase ARI8 [Momordica charantia]|uniref:RBR-type E3 ubiquitin transferase n=1 Tax=Momordica charantia TaxID=3673 RepID=A0A6J1DT24_MOMCH|nr:probable E3 ubiquitin-protein ligase ARI8 [Momordica charantia]
MAKTMCTICTATKAAADMFNSGGCSHSVCTDCISNHVVAKLEDNAANLKCPAPYCEAALAPERCNSFLPKQVLECWGNALCEAMTKELAERMSWKKCPHCKIYVEKTEGCSHIICMCTFEFCYSCGGGWNSNHACPQ